MTAKELNTMVNAMRNAHNKINTRCELENTLFYLYKGLKAIGKNKLATELIELYTEIDSVDTNEIIKLGTFK